MLGSSTAHPPPTPPAPPPPPPPQPVAIQQCKSHSFKLYSRDGNCCRDSENTVSGWQRGWRFDAWVPLYTTPATTLTLLHRPRRRGGGVKADGRAQPSATAILAFLGRWLPHHVFLFYFLSGGRERSRGGVTATGTPDLLCRRRPPPPHHNERPPLRDCPRRRGQRH